MARVKQNIKISKTTTRTKTRTKKNNGKKGNPNRCPTCGRFI